ncbi:MAG: 2-oxoglutarate dehydrogenase complex dihydrolipoyllysine-residue succinyltransferase [Verrucomicrobiota bacterium]
MAIELKVPEVGESITEVEIGDWLKKEGDAVAKDENVVMIESEKATVELSAPDAGKISKILKRKGEVAKVGEVIGLVESNGQASAENKKTAEEKPKAKAPVEKTAPAKVETKPVAKIAEKEIKSADIGGRLRKESAASFQLAESELPAGSQQHVAGREEEVVPMTLLRRTVAKHLVEAQQTMAMLTTFNEIDLSAVIALRKEFQEKFLEKHGVKPGFMSFFVKATIEALKLVPQVNAEIRGNNIVYHNYFDIGVAIGGGKGLVVPVLRNAERMSFAEIEIAIGDLAKRAKENKLKPDELQGGTFTISNGGVYGSLLSTPIVNPPQSGILGMHTIQERPVAIEGQVVIRPMMYVALSYDHRIVDGREAVTFLKAVKDDIEKPARILLEV